MGHLANLIFFFLWKTFFDEFWLFFLFLNLMIRNDPSRKTHFLNYLLNFLNDFLLTSARIFWYYWHSSLIWIILSLLVFKSLFRLICNPTTAPIFWKSNQLNCRSKSIQSKDFSILSRTLLSCEDFFWKFVGSWKCRKKNISPTHSQKKSNH